MDNPLFSEDFAAEVTDACVCPLCHSKLNFVDNQFTCKGCNRAFSNTSGIPTFMNKEMQSAKIQYLSQLYDRASCKYKDRPQSCGYSGNIGFYSRLNILKKWFNFEQVQGLKILDVGCGAGLLTEKLVKQNIIWGVDISPSLVTMARQKGLKAILSSADVLPFKNDNFDLVLCVGVIPYYKKPGKIISEICRTTKPKGKIVVSSSANSYLLRFVRFIKNALGLNSQLEHLYCYEEIEQLLKSEGMHIEDSCIGYNDNIWSFSNGPMNFKQKLFGRSVAVLCSAQPIP